MATKTLLPAFIMIAAAGGPQLLAQAPADLAPAVTRNKACGTAEENKGQGKRRALLGFARSLAGNLPMVGRGGVAASVAGQATAAAIDGVTSADTARAAVCAG